MRVIQLLPTISMGDAVSNDALAIAKVLRDMGYQTGIYAENIDNRLPACPVCKQKMRSCIICPLAVP